MKKEPLPPCAADALWHVRQVIVDGHPIGIMKIDECIEDVIALGLPGDAEIQAALVNLVRVYNYIPGPVEAAYARALLDEYRKAAREKDGR